MRDSINLRINGELHVLRGSDCCLSLSDYLRNKARLKGTKVVCAEGDCGACTVMVKGPFQDSFRSINSCISMVAILDGFQIVTIEGLKDSDQHHEIQKCMVENNGAQCGFCTPGFVMAMADLYENNNDVDEKKCRNYLTGNLCRCTGYSSILDAALSVDPKNIKKLDDIYNQKIEHSNKSVVIKTESFEFYAPDNYKEALELKNKYPNIRIISSATDIGVQINKEIYEPDKLLSLQNIPEAYKVEVRDHEVIVGAKVNLTELENAMEGVDDEFASFLRIFASPQIKNFGTLVGNIANASPIGDTLPYLSVIDARITLESVDGGREVPFNGFYTGYKKLDIKPNELITAVILPRRKKEEFLKVYKVSRRKDLDISCVNAAIKMSVENGNIAKINIAYGGVGPTVLKLNDLEKFMTGRPFDADSFRDGSHKVKDSITPMSDVRGSDEYRYLVAKNLFQSFYLDAKGTLDGN